MSCTRSQEFLANNDATIDETTIANKIRFDAEGALKIAREAGRVWVAKGKKITKLDVAKATEEELLKVLLGPSGKLRAPVIRSGDLLLVGFNADLYAEALR